MAFEIKPTPKIVQSASDDPWFNLSLEEYLLDHLSPQEVILYLWQNDHTVVIGRNQNAWKECNWEELAQSGGKLARRLSGGGAVYHDLGNLNFTFLMHTENYDLERQLRVILDAIKELGLEACFSGRNDLLMDNRKFSGHAYYHRDNKVALHHGTILVHSDLEKLTHYLNPSQNKITSKGIDSVRSRVVNLTELKPSLTIDQVKRSIQECFINDWSPSTSVDPLTYPITTYTAPLPKDTDGLQHLSALYERYASWEWRFGQSPNFDISFSERFTWGEIELGFQLKQGRINACTIFSDAMDQELIRNLAQRFTHQLLNREELVKAIRGLNESTEENPLLNDLISWIKGLNL